MVKRILKDISSSAWTREELECAKLPEEWYKNIFNFSPVEGHVDMLLVWVTGEAAMVADSLPDEDIIEKCCHLLRSFTGDPTLPPADVVYRSE